MNKEININKSNKSITFQNRGIGFTQIRIAGEILDLIDDLQQENKILKENAEHNDKVVDNVNWENMLLKKENQQLKDNWNELKEWVNKHYDYYMNNEDYIGGRLCFTDMKDKIQELEGSYEED